jgi:hypothetical protein
MDIGGVVWEGDEAHSSLDQALGALAEGIAEENGRKMVSVHSSIALWTKNELTPLFAA